MIQHVTFHLADSLPKDVLTRFEEELRFAPTAQRDTLRRKKIEAWIDAGHGSCVLSEPEVGRMVQDSLLFFDAQRYRLIAWVVMPNHVHTLFEPIHGWTVAKIIASWKKFTARSICDFRRGTHRAKTADQEIGLPGIATLPSGCAVNYLNAANAGNETDNTADREIGGPGAEKAQPVWHREYWDRYIRDDNHFLQTIEYIHLNPVKAGLVARAEDWPWSSAAPPCHGYQ